MTPVLSCRAYDFDPNREAQAFQQAAPVAEKEEDAPKLAQRVSCFLLQRLFEASASPCSWHHCQQLPDVGLWPIPLGLGQWWMSHVMRTISRHAHA